MLLLTLTVPTRLAFSAELALSSVRNKYVSRFVYIPLILGEEPIGILCPSSGI
jgi:hypothetical protein